MSEEKKQPNIVKKVFERSSSLQERVSPLFTYYKNPKKAPKAPAKPSAKVADKEPHSRRLPVAIDFGSSRVKLLQLAQDANGAMEIVMMDEEEGATKQALEKVLSRNPVGPNVVVGLPAKETLTYNFTFPPMSEEDLREAVRWKIRQLRPFDLDEERVRYALLRWEGPLAESATGGQQRVTVVCVSSDNLNAKNAIVASVGLKPVSVHVSPLALVNVRRFGTTQRNSDEVVLWLDLGAEESVFIIEKGGVVYFMRNLSVTGKLLTKQVAQACRVTENEAEELKKKHGLDFWTPELQPNILSDEERSKDPAIGVCYALISMLENLVVDIEHSFKYFSYQVTQSQIPKFDRIILSGGSSSLKRLENFLGDRLAVPVERVEPFLALHIQDVLKSQRKDFTQDAMVYASAAGLALTPLIDKERVVNLLVPEKKKSSAAWSGKEIKFNPRLAGIAAGVAVLALVLPQVGAVFFYKNQADSYTRQVKDARAELARRQSSQLELAEQEKTLLDKKNSLEEKLTLFHQSGRDGKDFSKTLSKLASLMPQEIWVTKLSYSDKKLTVVGATAKNEQIVSFLENLKKPSDFSDVTFNYTQRDVSAAVYSFEIMMNVK